jgi:hypothetical protein
MKFFFLKMGTNHSEGVNLFLLPLLAFDKMSYIGLEYFFLDSPILFWPATYGSDERGYQMLNYSPQIRSTSYRQSKGGTWPLAGSIYELLEALWGYYFDVLGHGFLT